MTPPLKRSEWVAIACLMFGFTLLCVTIYANVPSPDFLASWMAGKFWVAGETHNIYPPLENGMFDLFAPRDWYEALTVDGETQEVFPFIYPPIWVFLAGKLSQIVDYETIRTFASYVNPVLLASCALLALRITRRPIPVIPALLIGMVFFSLSAIGQIALMQNQFQILVAFLTLLSIERSRNGHEIAGGAALALAAAIKLYPAIFVILFLAGGHRRTAVSFVGFGIALGLLSIALTGWPLHALFLHTVSTISGTVLVTPVSWSFDPMIGQMFFEDTLRNRPIPEWTALYGIDMKPGEGFFFMAKPALWKALSSGAMLATMALGAVLIRRAERQGADSGWVWAFVMGLFALANPLSWSYHYIAIAAFAPLFVFRIGLLRGVVWIAVIAILSSNFAPQMSYWVQDRLHWPLVSFQVLGTLVMTAMVASFGYCVYHRH
ncbi:glycosyltransferase family 87 protein [Celeribacter sp.]|uniref:glycosyltransferase family 87 protein n=1 Tax=Celeribacter sp. TaxID=1890673 RepID=UPI003A950E5F